MKMKRTAMNSRRLALLLAALAAALCGCGEELGRTPTIEQDAITVTAETAAETVIADYNASHIEYEIAYGDPGQDPSVLAPQEVVNDCAEKMKQLGVPLPAALEGEKWEISYFSAEDPNNTMTKGRPYYSISLYEKQPGGGIPTFDVTFVLDAISGELRNISVIQERDAESLWEVLCVPGAEIPQGWEKAVEDPAAFYAEQAAAANAWQAGE